MRKLSGLSLALVLGCTKSSSNSQFDTNATQGHGNTGDETTDSVTNGAESTAGSGTTTVDSDGASDSTGTISGQCNDGAIDGDEVCDGTLFADVSCQSLGFDGGELTCRKDCLGYSTDACFGCGNNRIEAPEECDGVLDEKVTCESLGYTAGTPACDPRTCRYDVSQCSLCGNNEVEGDEECDTEQLGAATCEGMGFDGGTLACIDGACTLDFAACAGGGYTQDFESGSLPSEFSFGGNAGWIVTGAVMIGDNFPIGLQPITGNYSARSGDISHSEASLLGLGTIFASGGTISFRHRESTEAGTDFLQFYIDGELQDAWSGDNATTLASYDVLPGRHSLQWRYIKDASLNANWDHVWIDDLVLVGGVVAP